MLGHAASVATPVSIARQDKALICRSLGRDTWLERLHRCVRAEDVAEIALAAYCRLSQRWGEP